MKKNNLHWQVLISMILGCIVGLIFKTIPSNIVLDFSYQIITLCGVLFIRLLKMIMVPLILTSIIIGVSSIRSGKKVGRLGVKTFLYYLSTSLIAIIIGLSLSNIMQPGLGATIVENTSFDLTILIISNISNILLIHILGFSLKLIKFYE